MTIKPLRSAFRILALCVSSASIAAALPPGARVHFATCTLPGVEHGCVIATSGGAQFDVTHAKPGIAPYQWLQGVATATDRVSICQQGQVVANFVPDKRQAPDGCVHRDKVKYRP
jgi:hypothetical protein